MIFWVFVCLIVAFTCLGLGLAWYGHFRVGSSEEASERILYDARLLEIQRDVEEGRIDEDAAETARTEAARRLIKYTEPDHPDAIMVRKRSKWMLGASLVLVPVLAFLVYLPIGTFPGAFTPVEQAAPASSQELREMLAEAEKRLSENPDDVRGWRAVGPIYIRSGRLDDAEHAFRQILRIEGPSSGILAVLGEILVAKNKGQVNNEALEVFKQTLDLDENDVSARFFIATAASQRGETQIALSIWQEMIDDSKGDEDWLPAVKERVEKLSTITRGPAVNSDTAKAILEAAPQDRMEAIKGMVAQLSGKLDDKPDNKEGWSRLVRAYMVLGEKDEAEKALERARSFYTEDKTYIDGLKDIIDNFGGAETSAGQTQ